MIYQQKLHPPAPYHEDAPCVEFSAIRFPGDLTLVYAAFLGAISAHNFDEPRVITSRSDMAAN